VPLLRRTAHARTHGPEALAWTGTVFVLDGGFFCSRGPGDRPPALFFRIYGNSEKGGSKGENPGRRLGGKYLRKVPPKIKVPYYLPAFPRQHHLAFSLLEP